MIMEKKTKKASNKKTNVKNKKLLSKTKTTNKVVKSKGNKKKIKPMIIVDYTFLISLVLSIIFGLQTNTNFLLPFIIVLVITLVCMGIILVNAVYSKIKKVIAKNSKEI